MDSKDLIYLIANNILNSFKTVVSSCTVDDKYKICVCWLTEKNKYSAILENNFNEKICESSISDTIEQALEELFKNCEKIPVCQNCENKISVENFIYKGRCLQCNLKSLAG